MKAIWFSCIGLFIAASVGADDEACPYSLDLQWRQMLEDGQASDRVARGEKLIVLIEESLGLKVPEWWGGLAKGVGSGVRSAHMIEDVEALEKLAGRWDNSSNVPFTGFKNANYSADGQSLIVFDGVTTIGITSQFEWSISKESKNERKYGVAGTVHKERCFIVPRCPANTIGGAEEIYCVHSDTGQLLWKAKSLTGLQGAYNPREFGSLTEVVINGDHVVVWTGSEVAAIVQAYRILDGKPVLQFSTNGLRQ